MEELIQFLTQAIAGTYMSLYRSHRDLYLFCKPTYVIYLNSCWHSYGKKDDEYIVETFDKILKDSGIKGSVCLMHWLLNVGITILDVYEVKEYDEIDMMRTILYESIKSALQATLSKYLKDITCNGDNCDNKYDGKDIFIMK
jgi:hypothetical protein